MDIKRDKMAEKFWLAGVLFTVGMFQPVTTGGIILMALAWPYYIGLWIRVVLGWSH